MQIKAINARTKTFGFPLAWCCLKFRVMLRSGLQKRLSSQTDKNLHTIHDNVILLISEVCMKLFCKTTMHENYPPLCSSVCTFSSCVPGVVWIAQWHKTTVWYHGCGPVHQPSASDGSKEDWRCVGGEAAYQGTFGDVGQFQMPPALGSTTPKAV